MKEKGKCWHSELDRVNQQNSSPNSFWRSRLSQFYCKKLNFRFREDEIKQLFEKHHQKFWEC